VSGGEQVNGQEAAGNPQPLVLPAFDPANPLPQTPMPTTLSADLVTGQQGQFLRLCVRTPDTSLIVYLRREDANAWGLFLQEQAAGMSGLIVPGGGIR